MRAMGQEVPKTKRVLELNPDHKVVETMQGIFDAKNSDPRLNDFAELLYGQALLAEGELPPDPARFGKLVTELMTA